MMFVVEGPANASPHAWFAFDDADLLGKVCADSPWHPWEVWDCATARELLDLVDETPDSPGVRERFPAMCALGEQEGWDTPLYRADLLIGQGVYRPEPVACVDACVAALRSRCAELRVYASESVALTALDLPDPWFDAPSGWRARRALRNQLIATEVLSDGH